MMLFVGAVAVCSYVSPSVLATVSDVAVFVSVINVILVNVGATQRVYV